MQFITCAVTDVGQKSVNQDAVMIKVADTDDYGRIAMGAVCDGVGGLTHGEVASKTIIRRFEKWFHNELPDLLVPEDSTAKLDVKDEEQRDIFLLIKNQWGSIVNELNDSLALYGKERSINLGSTAVVMLLMGGRYIVMNVGDSRAYMITEKDVIQITHDQSYIQMQIDKGLITEEEAKNNPSRGVLLQCIGASDEVVPDYHQGEFKGNTSFLLCCDGFWKLSTDDDIRSDAAPTVSESESVMEDSLKNRIRLLKDAGETDNISVVVIGARER